MLLPGNHEEVPSTGRVGTLRSACRSRTHAAPTAKCILLWKGRNLGLEVAASASERAVDSRSTRWRSWPQRKRRFLRVGPRLTKDDGDTEWRARPAPLSKFGALSLSNGLVAGLQLTGKSARRQAPRQARGLEPACGVADPELVERELVEFVETAAALHRTASTQLWPARYLPGIFPSVQRRRGQCA